MYKKFFYNISESVFVTHFLTKYLFCEETIIYCRRDPFMDRPPSSWHNMSWDIQYMHVAF